MKSSIKKFIQLGLCLIPVLMLSSPVFAAGVGTIAAGGDSMWATVTEFTNSGYGSTIRAGMIVGALWLGWEGKVKPAIIAGVVGEGVFRVPDWVAPTGFALDMLGA